MLITRKELGDLLIRTGQHLWGFGFEWIGRKLITAGVTLNAREHEGP